MQKRRNLITFARNGARLRAIVNGREVLNYTDPEPLEVDRVAVGGYDTSMNFSHIEIRD